jgi:hypothetical protein
MLCPWTGSVKTSSDDRQDDMSHPERGLRPTTWQSQAPPIVEHPPSIMQAANERQHLLPQGWRNRCPCLQQLIDVIEVEIRRAFRFVANCTGFCTAGIWLII